MPALRRLDGIKTNPGSSWVEGHTKWYITTRKSLHLGDNLSSPGELLVTCGADDLGVRLFKQFHRMNPVDKSDGLP